MDIQGASYALIKAGAFMHSRGWVPATSGNFSARLDDGSIAITVSGRHKGQLTPDDIMRVDMNGASLDGRKPSAETLLHTTLYQRYPDVHSVLHPHSLGAMLVSRLFSGKLHIHGYELLKALNGITTHESEVDIPIFENSQDITALSQEVLDYLDANGDIYGYIIAHHGFYTWGNSVDEALRHVEALEFLFNLEARLKGVPA
ncbi:MAG TPA: methylthioribulose 1-phosphate dehydratase [Methylophilaceae bacterium]|nr:methylthioribulose 1-phosphate dehydratase [Methylophilaceae bacterium]